MTGTTVTVALDHGARAALVLVLSGYKMIK
jgi:hypothetical protein